MTHKLTGWKDIIVGDRDGCMFLTVRFWMPEPANDNVSVGLSELLDDEIPF